MTPSKRGKLDGVASPDAGGDRISALPDDALHHVLSFLPAEDAVRTCVLARRWRHLWKFATRLRIGFGNGDTAPSVDSIRNFVNHLLLLRKGDSSIHTCELRLESCFSWSDQKEINLWIRHVVDREVRILRLEILHLSDGLDMDRLHLVSQHLKTLALINVRFYSPWNLSNCSNLQHLEIAESHFAQIETSSKSLKHLSINNCFFESHTLICTPNLVSLWLDGHFFSVPVLGSMPSLKEAFVRSHFYETLGCEYMEGCVTCADGSYEVPADESEYKNKCFLLQGLSEAESLTLMCHGNAEVFNRDLQWCPTFNNLRTLLLDDWCLDPDLYGLNLILKHSPVLEKLNIHLFTNAPQPVEMVGKYNQMERSVTIPHMKEIRVKCKVVNKKVYKVLKFLGTFGIHFLFM